MIRNLGGQRRSSTNMAIFVNKKNVSNYDFILKNIDHFKAPGGLLLIIYSWILNQGTEKINKDRFFGHKGSPALINIFPSEYI